jgi:hypothetical protein
MDGRVVLLNQKAKVAALRTNSGEYVVIEIIDKDFDLESGDLLSGNLRSLGEAKIVNLSKRRLMAVRVRDTGCKVAYRTKKIVFEGLVSAQAG